MVFVETLSRSAASWTLSRMIGRHVPTMPRRGHPWTQAYAARPTTSMRDRSATLGAGPKEAPIRPRRLTMWLFLRSLGLVHAIAFASYGVQVRGLIGASGIVPAALQRDSAEGPSLFW